uniref:Uncharacterized protein n=1 Tax=uncultured Thiotrichaceae bacterium TaxID=298394 RepID=A0A6S6SFR5_9GAMM|nr:MAG: Unknown protein [uncultured Thiotrichaceae bacterium]
MTAHTFITLSVIIAILQLVESLNLYSNRGKLTGLAMTISTLEFIWLLVCVYALFSISFPDWTIFLPAAFVSYIIVATWHSRHLTKDIEDIESAKELIIPKNLAMIALGFSTSHLVVSGFAWLQYAGT